jgi:hypothetical protein
MVSDYCYVGYLLCLDEYVYVSFICNSYAQRLHSHTVVLNRLIYIVITSTVWHCKIIKGN